MKSSSLSIRLEKMARSGHHFPQFRGTCSHWGNEKLLSLYVKKSFAMYETRQIKTKVTQRLCITHAKSCAFFNPGLGLACEKIILVKRYHDFDMKKVWFCGKEKIRKIQLSVKCWGELFYVGRRTRKGNRGRTCNEASSRQSLSCKILSLTHMQNVSKP